MPELKRPSELSFEYLCTFFDMLKKRQGKSKEKRTTIEEFIKQCIWRKTGEAFDVFRLVLPNLDTERGNYNLKEAALGQLFVKALGWDKKDPRAKSLLNYRDPGIAVGAGDLSAIVEDRASTQARVTDKSPLTARTAVKIKDINEKLDELATVGGNQEKQIPVMRYFLTHCTPRQLKWITQIILKNMKHGAGETMIFSVWHPDGQELYDSTMSLRRVFNELTDKDTPANSTGVSPGNPVRPQLAIATNSAAAAFAKMHMSKANGGKLRPFLIESKFDGERIQVHRQGNTVSYYSRRAIEHGERSKYNIMDGAIIAGSGNNDRIILDGEMIVWNTKRQVMEPFGTLKHTVNAAESGKPATTEIKVDDYGGFLDRGNDGGDTAGTGTAAAAASLGDDTTAAIAAVAPGPSQISQSQAGAGTPGPTPLLNFNPPKLGDLELLYIAFDVLYCDGQSQIKKPLEKRLELLKEIVPPGTPGVRIPGSAGICARIIPMVPGETFLGGILASKEASTLEEIEEAIQGAKARREEGIIIKALDSQWKPNDRSDAWLKIKPDYIERLDIDAVILGGWYGQGSRAGDGGAPRITQYLMGLCEQPSPGCDSPTGFVTFCRVGTGLTDEETSNLNASLQHLYIQDVTAVPACVQATGREKPDVWIKDPFKSMVLQLQSDVRLISSITFKARASLRFPRVERIRYDKSAVNATWDETLIEEVRTLIMERESGASGKRKGRRGAGGSLKRLHLAPLDHIVKERAALAAIQEESEVFKGKRFFIKDNKLPRDGRPSKQELDAMVKRLGGQPWIAFNNKIDYVIAYRLDDDYMRMHLKNNPQRSVLSPGWIERCAATRTLCPLRPRDFLYMAPGDKRPSRDVDRYGDSFYQDADPEDVAALVQHHIAPEDISLHLVIQTLMTETPAAPALPAETLPPGPLPPVPMTFAQRKLQNAVDSVQRRRVIPSGRTLLGWLDAKLAGVGKLNPSRALLHGCTVLVISISIGEEGEGEGGDGLTGVAGKGLSTRAKEDQEGSRLLSATVAVEGAESSAAATVLRLRLSKLKLAAKLHGAKVVNEMTPEVTHLVGVISTNSAYGSGTANSTGLGPAPSPRVLLRAVKDQAGGVSAIQSLETSLQDGNVELVTAEWLEDSIGKAVQPTPGGALSSSLEDIQPEDSVEYPLLDVEAMQKIPSWLWEEFLPPGTGQRHHGQATLNSGRQSSKKKGTAGGRGGHVPVPGEIVHVAAPRKRGTALKKGQRSTRAAGNRNLMEESSEGITNGTASTVSESEIGTTTTNTNTAPRVGSVAKFAMEEVPMVKSKPAEKQTAGGAIGKARKPRASSRTAKAPPSPPIAPIKEEILMEETTGKSAGTMASEERKMNMDSRTGDDLLAGSPPAPAPPAAAPPSFLDMMASMPMSMGGGTETVRGSSNLSSPAVRAPSGNFPPLASFPTAGGNFEKSSPLPAPISSSIPSGEQYLSNKLSTLPEVGRQFEGDGGLGKGAAGAAAAAVAGSGTEAGASPIEVPLPSSLDEMMETKPYVITLEGRDVAGKQNDDDGGRGGGGSRTGVGVNTSANVNVSPSTSRPKMSLREARARMLASKNKPNE